MRLVLTIIFFWMFVGYSQHTPLLTQYMFNSIALNPANTGSQDCFSVVGSFRGQWVGLDGAPMTQVVTAHAPLKKTNSNFGVQLFSDKIGVNFNIGAFVSYAYKIKLKKSNLRFGLLGGINFIKSRYSELFLKDVTDQVFQNDSPLGILPDFSFGTHYDSKKYFLSFSIPFFLSHTFDGNKFKVQNKFNEYNLMLGGGYIFSLSKSVKLKPSTLLKWRNNSMIQADFNLMLLLNDFVETGVSFRTSESIIVLFSLKPSQQFAFMYSLGIPITPIVNYSYGSHELSLRYNFLYKSTISAPRYLGW